MTIPVVLGGDASTGISALDFRLTYNPEVLRPVSAGPGNAAAGADKRVMANISSPGEYIVVMMGMNQTTCATGEVAKVVMERVADSPDTNWDLGIKRQTLSSLDGTVISSEVIPYQPTDTSDPEEPNKPSKPDTKPDDESSSTQPESAKTVPAAVEAADSPPGRVESSPTKDAAKRAPDKDRLRAQLARALAERDRVRGQIGGPGAESSDSDESSEEASEGPDGGMKPTGAHAENSPQTAHDDSGDPMEVARAGGNATRTVEMRPIQATGSAVTSNRLPRYVVMAAVGAAGIVAAFAIARLMRGV